MFEHAGHSDAQGSPTSTELLARTLRYARRYVQWFALAAILAAITAVGRNARAYLLKPLLAEGRLRCMGSTTYQEYRGIFDKDRALSRRFQKIDVIEPSYDECVEQYNQEIRNLWKPEFDNAIKSTENTNVKFKQFKMKKSYVNQLTNL